MDPTYSAFFLKEAKMRSSPFTTISLLIAVLLAAGCLPAAVQAAEPGMLQVSDNPGANTIAPPQCGCGCQSEPSCQTSVCDRFAKACCSDAYWSFAADGLALQRSNTRKQTLFFGRTFDTFDAEHLNSCTGFGFQLDAIRHGPCGWDVELGYFQVDGWIANHSVPGTSLMVTDNSQNDFIVTDSSARYWSALHLAEINIRREWCEGLTLFAGFRAGELDEAYNAHGTDDTSLLTDLVSARTVNHLYGLQIGANWECYNQCGPLRISAVCKAGIYDNVATQTITRSDSVAVDQQLDAHRDQATFMGEAGAVATYDVTCHLSFRASFTAVWLEGLALAPEQLSVNSFSPGGAAGIDTSGGLFYYGGGLGMELRY
jgi:hypothetical protein